MLRCGFLAWILAAVPMATVGQAGDKALKAEADALFEKGAYAKAWPMYSQLVSLSPQDHVLNYKLGACSIYGDDDKSKAIGYLRYAVSGPATPELAWYFLGRAYQLDYRFDNALDAYRHYKGTVDKKLLVRFPVDAFEQQCRNGKYLLSNLKDIEVLNKLEVDGTEFFRFYDLSDIGGKIVVTPDELLSGYDRKSGERFLVYLPHAGGTIYFSSYGKDGRTGRDIYRTQLLPTGNFAAPQKLAGYINTDQDEDFPVMSPDGKTFYFCSKGHNSMGGYDVFRSMYDAGMDVFSAPENMDFAVNTPADEMLYIVGPDGGQACFASDRDSRQGQVNVYRVSTTQTPLNLTVLKGTYTSISGVTGKNARIIVEDEVTRERVADVRTGEDGDYVLVLPKGGQYKFLVEDGETGRTYWSRAEAPPAHTAQAFRQEIQVNAQGGGQLEVRTFFDQPLDEDVMALALEEIRRRARLDVTSEGAVAETPDPSREGDPLQAAGFDGTVTLPDAVAMAKEEAQILTAKAMEQERAARGALDLAQRNAEEAERYSAQAASLLRRANAAGTSAEKEALMRDAAEAKQLSEWAWARAQVGYRTGRALQTAAATTQAMAQRSDGISRELTQAMAANDKVRQTTALKQLKSDLDAKKGPDAQLDEQERMRREASEATDVAARQLSRAQQEREEERMLADRIQRMAREAESAKGKKKQDLEQQLAVLRDQHKALQEEVEQAFGSADRAEEEAELTRGQVTLVRHLAANRAEGDNNAAAPQAWTELEQRLAQVRAGNKGLQIDRQYVTTVFATAQERERHIFDWGTGDIQALATTTRTTTAGSDGGSRTPVSVTPTRTVAASMERMDTRTDLPARDAGQGTVVSGGTTAGRNAVDRQDEDVAPDLRTAQAGTSAAVEQPGTARTGLDQVEEVSSAASGQAAMSRDEEAFVLANRLAELEQLRQAERNRTKRDSLDREIADQKARIEAFRSGEGTTVAVGAGTDRARPRSMPVYTYLEFDTATLDEELVEDIFPGFSLERQAILDGEGSGQDKAARLHALEMQLIDSIDAQSARAVAYLEGNPERSAQVLPRMERWQRLKEDHVAQANNALAEAGQEYAASETRALEDEQLTDRRAAPRKVMIDGVATSTPHNDSYIRVEKDLDKVYASPLTARSPKQADAIAQKDMDLGRAEVMQAEIDSLEQQLTDVMAVKDYNKMRQQIDRKIDDLLIHNVDVGQRTAFISRNEFAAAKDSAKVLAKSVAQRGVASSEPLAQMARSFEQEAEAGMARAKTMRKQADNANDIFQRNSLYRLAYTEELNALRDMDRSHTVRNYLLSGQALPGEDLTYEEVEFRQFPMVFAQAEPAPDPVKDGPQIQGDAEAGQAPVNVVVDVVASEGTARDLAEEGTASDDPSAGERAPVQDPVQVVAAPVSTEVAAVGAASAPVRTVADSLTLAGYLDRFYYLDETERLSILQSAPQGHYFLMKGNALRDRADAVTLREEAEGAVQLATVLRGEAGALRNEGAAGGTDQIQKLETRADALMHRADSLHTAADRLVASSDRADGQAATWMQGLPTDLSTFLMDLEQSKRRTEPVLARTRPQPPAYTPRPVPEVAVVTTQQPVTAGADVAERPSTPVEVPAAQVPVAPPVEEPVARTAPPAVEERTAPAPRVVAAPRTAEPLARDLFSFQETPAPRTEAIPIDAPMPTGVVFKVQVGAFRNALPMEAFNDMTPVTGEQAGNGLVRYTAGMFTTSEAAREASAKVRGRGYRDAFVVAYIDGKRVQLREGLEAERRMPAHGTTGQVAATTPERSTTVPGTGTVTVTTGTTGVTPARTVDLTDGTAQTATEAVLAEYPATAEEVLATFVPSATATDYYNDPAAAPASQVEVVKGLFFTVQVGVYSKPTPLDRLFNITPLNSELTANGKIRYTTGMFMNEAQAAERRNGAVVLGVTDAFITAYLNGKRIPIRDARALLAKFGTAILADPAAMGR